MYGNDIILQRLEDDWIDVPTLPNVGWKDISMNLNPEESFDCTVDLKQLFGEQEKGQYRIIKDMTTDSTTISVIVEFNVE